MAKNKLKKNTENRKNYWQYLVPLLIIIITMVVYRPAMDNAILHGWDDTEYLVNEDVQNMNLGGIFTDYHLGMYQPLPVASISMNYLSAGDSPRAYHATNIFLHIINIILIWVFLLGLTRKRFIAGIGAFLFALHPMNVEPVSWIAARSTLLFTAFYIAGLISYLKYNREKKGLYLGLTAAFATLALFSKSLAISFPLAMLLIDYYQGRKWNTRLWVEKIPFFALAIVFGYITVDAAAAYGHISPLEQDYSLADRFFILCHTYVFYLVQFVAPHHLSSVYAYPDLRDGSLPLLYYLSAVIPLLILALVWIYRKKQRELIAALLFFTVAVGPTLPLFWSRVMVAADRYAYLSFIGLSLFLGILVERAFRKKHVVIPYQRYGIAVVIAAFGIFMIYTSYHQIPYWKSGDLLLSRSVQLSTSGPEKALSYFYRGNIRQNIAESKYRQGQASGNENMIRNSFIYYRDAVTDYDSVLKYDPEHMLTYSNRGMIYGTLSSYDEKYWEMARQDFDRAINLDPGYADNYYNKAWLIFITGDKEQACQLWKKARELGSVVAEKAIIDNCESQ